MTEQFWNERYETDDFVYGKTPNEFLADQLKNSQPGKILLPADGEGRNALFATQLGWEVTAFDYSSEGVAKAQQLMKENDVSWTVYKDDLASFSAKENDFDTIAFIFVPIHEKDIHHVLNQYLHFLKPGGKLILEAFTKEQLQHTSGGPKDPAFLYDLMTIQPKHIDAHLVTMYKKCIHLDEGPFHQGDAAIIRLVFEKN